MDNEKLLEIKGYVQDIYLTTQDEKLLEIIKLIDEARTSEETKKEISDYLEEINNKVKKVENEELERIRKEEHEKLVRETKVKLKMMEKIDKMIEEENNELKKKLLEQLKFQPTMEKSRYDAVEKVIKNLGASGILSYIKDFNELVGQHMNIWYEFNFEEDGNFYELVKDLFEEASDNFLWHIVDDLNEEAYKMSLELQYGDKQ